MAEKMRYVAVLTGADIDLQLLAHCFINDECKVICSKLPGVGEGQFYHLISTALEMEPHYERKIAVNGSEQHEFLLDCTIEKAKDEADRLLNVMHGAARLVRAKYKPISISSMHKFDLSGRLVGSFSSGPWGDSRRSYPMPSNRKGLTELVRQWAFKGLEDDAVSLALSMYGTQPLSWVMLYMIYEVIKDDVDNINRYMNKNDYKNFTKAANNARRLRSGPRHAFKTKVHEEELLTLQHGEAIIRGLLKRWLGNKVGQNMQ